MGLRKDDYAEFGESFRRVSDAAPFVAKCLAQLPNSLPTDDLNSLRRLRPILYAASEQWPKTCREWRHQWRVFFSEDDNWMYGEEPRESGWTIYADWIEYAKSRPQDEEGLNSICDPDDEYWSERLKPDLIITQPNTMFRLDPTIVVLLGEIYTLAIKFLESCYSRRAYALVGNDPEMKSWPTPGVLEEDRNIALGWIRDGIAALLTTADRLIRGDELRLPEEREKLNWSNSAAGGAMLVDTHATQTPLEKRKAKRMQWITQALLLVRDHPEWSDKNIAKAVKVAPSQLTRCREYQIAAAMARDGKPRRGFVTVNRDTKQNDVVAFDDDPAERDWD